MRNVSLWRAAHCRCRRPVFNLFGKAMSLLQRNKSSTPGRQEPASQHDHTVTSAHYQNHTAKSYENAFFYSSQSHYVDDLAQQVAQRLGFVETTANNDDDKSDKGNQDKLILLDVGGGTGNFTQAVLAKSTRRPASAIVMDPFLSPQQGDKNDKIRFVPKAAQDVFARDLTSPDKTTTAPMRFHKVLIKEVIHHIEPSELRVAVLRGIHERLVHSNPPKQQLSDDNGNNTTNTTATPSLLIITRPAVDIDYPLWEQAQIVWEENQPSADLLQQELRAAGFTQTKVEHLDYPCTVPLTEWQAMIQARFWSTFSHFSDAELQEACENKIPNLHADRIDDKGNLHFHDRLVFLTASHNGGL